MADDDRVPAPSQVTGTISTTLQSTATASPTGFSLFGKEVVLDGPAASAASPYQMSFVVDVDSLEGAAPADVAVFRNGVALTGCTSPTAAVPDPCVVSRGFAPGGAGDALVTVRTSHFSTWSLGRLDYRLSGLRQPVDAFPTLNATKAGSTIPVKFGLGGNRGLDVFRAGLTEQRVRRVRGGAERRDRADQRVGRWDAGLRRGEPAVHLPVAHREGVARLSRPRAAVPRRQLGERPLHAAVAGPVKGETRRSRETAVSRT